MTATIRVNGSTAGTALMDILMADDIQPGMAPSYQLCKELFLFHPLGAKMADAPIKVAQSQKRIISVPDSPEDRIVKAFTDQWEKDKADDAIKETATLARVYGIASLGLKAKEISDDKPIDPFDLAKMTISFSTFDPLNTAGSLVLNQNPDALDFMKVTDISVSGSRFHRSRAAVIMHDQPIYIAYTTSAFGFVGRSVYQRALFPLKTFIQSMITDDLVTVKAGVLVAKMEQPSSIVDNVMLRIFGQKRQLVKDAATGNVLSVGRDEDIQSLNFQNLHAPYELVRKNTLKNIATAADMPAVLLENETLTEGFGEGTEDAKNIAKYIEGVRTWLLPLYAFMNRIVMHRAWNPEFYVTIQKDFPDEYGGVDYNVAFYRWVNSFTAVWPNLLEEPDSEKVKVEQTKNETIISVVRTFIDVLDPDNKARLVQWAADNLNENKQLFTTPLTIDADALASYTPPMPGFGEGNDEDEGAPKPTKKMSLSYADAVNVLRIAGRRR